MNPDDLINKLYEQIYIIEDVMHLENSPEHYNHLHGQLQGLEIAITTIEKAFHRFTPIERA